MTPVANPPETVTLGPTNSIRMEHETVYTLVTEFCGTYFVNVLNLGPCTVYYSLTGDPAVNDPASVTMPPGTADNGIPINGPTGLKLIAGAPCMCQVQQEIDDPDCRAREPVLGRGATISVRLVQS